MSAAFVNRVNAFSGSLVTSLATAATNHTTGNHLAVLIQYQVFGPSSITDTAGNTYAACGAAVTNGGNTGVIWQAINIVGNANNVVTVNLNAPGSGYTSVTVIQSSGVDTASPLTTYSTATGSSTTPTSGTLSVSNGSAIITAIAENDAGAGMSGGTGYTYNNADGGNGFVGDEFKEVTTDEAASFVSANAAWYIAAASFSAPGGTAPLRVRRLRLLGVGM